MPPSFPNGTPASAATPHNFMTVDEQLDVRDLLLERGTTGLRRGGGWIREDLLPELTGLRGMQTYREMRDNSAVVGACLFAVEMLMRKVTWTVQPVDDSLEALKHAEIVEGMLFKDLDMSWSMLMSEILSFLPFGFSLFEVILKRRNGLDATDVPGGLPALPSQFDDGYLGIAKLAPRAQDTIQRWEFDQTGSLRGAHQLDSWMGRAAYLPYEKCLLFRPTSWKDSPESRSVLRNAYRAWFMVKHLENVQAIGAERELTGLPVIGAPPQWFALHASAEEQAQLEMTKRIGRNIRIDEQACIVHPLLYDQNGRELFKVSLLASPGSHSIDLNAIIQRYELRIAQSMLADVIFLGHESVGSFALSSDKTNILSMALGGYLASIADVFNRRLFPLLWKYNAFDYALLPTLAHGDVESVDLTELAQFIREYARAGFDVSDLDNHIRSLAGMPERVEEESPTTPSMEDGGEDARTPAPEAPPRERPPAPRARRQRIAARR